MTIEVGVTQLNMRCRGSMFRHQCGARCRAYMGVESEHVPQRPMHPRFIGI